MKKDEGVPIKVRKEHLERIAKISKASGVPVQELIEQALALYLERKKPLKQ